MAADDRVHLDVALEREGEAIRGTVSAGDCPPFEFSGWLELMSAFDIARSKAAKASEPQSSAVTRPATQGGA